MDFASVTVNFPDWIFSAIFTLIVVHFIGAIGWGISMDMRLRKVEGRAKDTERDMLRLHEDVKKLSDETVRLATNMEQLIPTVVEMGRDIKSLLRGGK